MVIDFDPPSNKPFSLPKGKYGIKFDGKILAEFGSLDEAQQNLARYPRGSHVVTPNLRKDMSEKDISNAEFYLRSLGFKTPGTI